MLLKIKLFPPICAQQMIYERTLMRFSVSDVGSVMLSQCRGHVAGRTATRCCPQRPFLQACLLSSLRPSIVADPSSSCFSETFSTRHLYILFGTSPTAWFIALRGLCLCWGIFLSLLPWSLDLVSGVPALALGDFGKPPTSPNLYFLIYKVGTMTSNQPT